MASDRTKRILGAANQVTQLGAAIRARRRLQEEAIKLNRVIAAARVRLAEIDEEETVLSKAIDDAGDAVKVAVADDPKGNGAPDPEPLEPLA